MIKQAFPKIALLVTLALFLTISGNLTFFSKLTAIYPLNEGNIAFLFSTSLLVLSLIIFVASALSCILGVRITMSFLVLLTVFSAYFSDSFGTIVDTIMIQNVLESSTSEASDLLGWHFFLRVLFLGVLPLAVIWMTPLSKLGYKKLLAQNFIISIFALGMVTLILLTSGSQYASFFREHKSTRHYSNPIYPLYSIVKYGFESFEGGEIVMKTALADAMLPENQTDKELVIVVVGETARRDRFSLNGYKRVTNPRLTKEERLVSYTNITSCGTSTAVSVPCMFSFTDQKAFTKKSIYSSENVLDVLQRVGVNILWRDNNSNSKGVADRVSFEDYTTPELNPVCDDECRDIGMLENLQTYIDHQEGDILIVLHQMGNHGPAYYKRYPKEFEYFTPVCKSAELQQCTQEEIDNAYDNAIRYTDYFLSNVIELLKENSSTFETAMIYASDHGESLGKNGIYLHGLPYFIAPNEQTYIPLLVWVDEGSDIDLSSLKKSSHMLNSHDALSMSLLSAFEVESNSAEESKLLFSLKKQ